MTGLRAPGSRSQALSWPIVAVSVAALLALISLTQPLWTFQVDTGGGDIDKFAYTWTTRVDEEWRAGALRTITITPYASPGFSQFRMRDAAATSYIVAASFAGSLVILAALLITLGLGRTSRSAVLGVHVVALLIGIAALAYGAIAIPPAALLDISPVVTGFWGQATTAPGEVSSWGPGLAWWLWAVSTMLALLALPAAFAQRHGLASTARAQ